MMQHCVRLLITVRILATALVAPRPHVRQPTRRRADEQSLDVDLGNLRLHVYGGRFGAQWDVKFKREAARRVSDDALTVKDSPGKGRGVFAAQGIAEGTFLGSYDGEVLDGAQFARRYGDRDVPEYVVRIDGDAYIDGRAAAQGDAYTPALFNDGGARSNVVRYCATRRPPRVDFFAGRDIRPGEELLFDYGSQYWAGRESDIDAALDAQIFDPEEIESFREDPENFKAVYAASVVAFGVIIGQAVVRWYKYNVWLPQPDSLEKTLDLIP